jgi:hypothetical protein
MKRRHLLQLGLFSAFAFAAVGGAAVWWQGGVQAGRLTTASRGVFQALGRAVLDGSLPAEAAARERALQGLLARIDDLVSALPPHAQDELAQLLGLLALAPGRLGLAGLKVEWSEATVQQLQQALQSMRTSSLQVRRQAYQALHDITSGAFFADRSAWSLLGYPGPLAI